MNNTINYLIGVMIALVAFLAAIYLASQSIFTQAEQESIQVTHQLVAPDMLTITWITQDNHKGYISYIDSDLEEGRDHEPHFTRNHRLSINISGLALPITYHVESCPVKGGCITQGPLTYN